MNIYDIAKKADVSIATVSRVLNKSSKVSPHTKEKVISAMRDSGYLPKASSTRPLSAKNKRAGILCAGLSNALTAKTADLLIKALDKSGYEATIIPTGNDILNKQQALLRLSQRKLSILFIIGNDFFDYKLTEKEYIMNFAADVPVFILNANIEFNDNEKNIFCISCDISDTIFGITQSFIKRGKSRLAFLYSSMNLDCISIFNAFSKAYEVQGLDVKPEYRHLCTGLDDLQQYLTAMYDKDLEIDAIIAADDYLAITAMNFLKKSELADLDSLEILGCGNSPFTQISAPSVSTIDFRIEEIVSTAISLMINFFNHSETATKTVLSAKFIRNKITKP